MDQETSTNLDDIDEFFKKRIVDWPLYYVRGVKSTPLPCDGPQCAICEFMKNAREGK